MLYQKDQNGNPDYIYPVYRNYDQEFEDFLSSVFVHDLIPLGTVSNDGYDSSYVLVRYSKKYGGFFNNKIIEPKRYNGQEPKENETFYKAKGEIA